MKPGRCALLLPLLLAAACGGEPPAAGAGAEAAPAPQAAALAIEVVDLEGLEAALAARRGQGVLLNFWAIWCAPCVAELPELLEVARAHRADGGAVLGVSYDLMVAGSDPATIHERMRAFLEARELSDFPVLVFDEPDYERVNERFGLPGEVPVTLAFDRDGQLVGRQEGQAGKERFEELMRAALGR